MALSDYVVPPYWNPGDPQVEAPSSTSISANLVKEWEKYLKSHGISTGERTLLSERLLLRETLWMMSGTKELFVFTWNGNEFIVNDNFKLSHVTTGTVKTVLEEICRCASYVVHLKEFISSVSGAKSSTLTVKAFASSVFEQLQPYSRRIVELERMLIAQKETLTLAMLLEDAKPHFERVCHIYNIFRCAVVTDCPENRVQQTVKLLSALEHALENATVVNQKNVLPQTVSLYLDSVKPYIDFIDTFSGSGILQDPFQEFPIRRNEDAKFSEGAGVSYWKDSLCVCDPGCSDTVIGPHLAPIISAGKSMEHLVHATESRRAVLPSKPGTLYSSIISSIRSTGSIQESKHAIPKQSTGLANVKEIREELIQWSQEAKCEGLIGLPPEPALSEIDVKCPLSCTLLQIKQAVGNAVAERCSENSAKFIHYLKSGCNLAQHIDVVHNHFLMFAGDIMHSFTTELFSRLLSRSPETWQNLSFLSFALQEALSWYHSQTPLLKGLSMKLRESSPKLWLDGFDNVVLTYSVAWPITIVLTDKTLALYNRIFVFLCKVKCAKFALEELSFHDLCCRADTPAMKQTAHSLQLLRFEIISFLIAFHSCLMQEALHGSKLVFDGDLERATDLDTVIKCHEDFVAKAFRQCLLGEPLVDLQEPILTMLKLCIKLHVLWNKGIKNILPAEVKSIEDSFLNAHIKFKHLAKIRVNRGYADSSQLLTFAMNSQYLQPVVA
ncbi:gamma-tubulin complex component 5-like [Haemaphysalis longicornis]|uniref:Gamma-tubulin complex component n=1 Tax=Haemaphysalis longicornis TaxID=44386 RepID=A0A9J6H048_HAELO|nr:hypothetical protein HPB48_010789 [Haemaphysalis longicornis]